MKHLFQEGPQNRGSLLGVLVLSLSPDVVSGAAWLKVGEGCPSERLPFFQFHFSQRGPPKSFPNPGDFRSGRLAEERALVSKETRPWKQKERGWVGVFSKGGGGSEEE